MAVIEKESILKSIKYRTLEVNSCDDFLGIYQFIKSSLTQEKDKIESLPIDLISVENIYGDYDKLEHHRIILQKQKREVIHVFTFGDFSQDSEITWKLADIFSDFLVEYLIIPVLNNINYGEFKQRENDILKNINNSIIVMKAKEAYLETNRVRE